MNRKHKKIGIFLISLLSLFILSQLIFAAIYHHLLSSHIYTEENMHALPAFSDYDHLSRRREDCYSMQGKKLAGWFYYDTRLSHFKGVILINNGFGSGHIGLISEIDAFAKNGYLVYGFDKTGYDESEGSGIGHLSQGIDDLKSVITAIHTSKSTKDLPIILYGKSWGAYCCCCALAQTSDVTAAVSLAGFDTSIDMLQFETKRRAKYLSPLATPVLKLYDHLNGDDRFSCMKGLASTNAKVLLMHSEDDPTVPIDKSLDLLEQKLSYKKNLTFVHVDHQGHNLTYSEASQNYNEQMNKDLAVFLDKQPGEMTSQKWNDFLSSYDLKQCFSLDPSIMGQIITFCDVAVGA